MVPLEKQRGQARVSVPARLGVGGGDGVEEETYKIGYHRIFTYQRQPRSGAAFIFLGHRRLTLYGGTRHSLAIALKKYRTPEEIKRATMHSTNKAFERYFWIETGDLREIYRDTVGRGRGIRVEE